MLFTFLEIPALHLLNRACDGRGALHFGGLHAAEMAAATARCHGAICLLNYEL